MLQASILFQNSCFLTTLVTHQSTYFRMFNDSAVSLRHSGSCLVRSLKFPKMIQRSSFAKKLIPWGLSQKIYDKMNMKSDTFVLSICYKDNIQSIMFS